MLKHDIMLPLL